MRYHKLLKCNSDKTENVDKFSNQAFEVGKFLQARYDLTKGSFWAELNHVEDDILEDKVSLVFFYETDVELEKTPPQYGLKL